MIDPALRLSVDFGEPETEELGSVPLTPPDRGERHICTECCEHSSDLQVTRAAIDMEAGVLSARLQAHVELKPSDCFRIEEVRLRIRLRFRYQGHELVERVLPFLSDYDESCTYRERDGSVGKVVSVEADRWDPTPQELTLFEHEDHLVHHGDLQTWHLPFERVCFDLDWPPDVPSHRPESAKFLLSPVLHYRLARRGGCTHDHVRGLGDFYIKPPTRRRVGLS